MGVSARETPYEVVAHDRQLVITMLLHHLIAATICNKLAVAVSMLGTSEIVVRSLDVVIRRSPAASSRMSHSAVEI
ncbi:hypothetical protein YC2023_008466 [Brassica napus]